MSTTSDRKRAAVLTQSLTLMLALALKPLAPKIRIIRGAARLSSARRRIFFREGKAVIARRSHRFDFRVEINGWGVAGNAVGAKSLAPYVVSVQ